MLPLTELVPWLYETMLPYFVGLNLYLVCLICFDLPWLANPSIYPFGNLPGYWKIDNIDQIPSLLSSLRDGFFEVKDFRTGYLLPGQDGLGVPPHGQSSLGAAASPSPPARNSYSSNMDLGVK